MKGWKTFIFGLLTAMLGFAASFDFTTIVNEQTSGFILTGVGILTMILRAVTDSSIFTKDE